MSANDWNSAEAAHTVSLPSIVSSTDLFDGEIFGDELMDIYHSTVDHHDPSDDIPLLGHVGTPHDLKAKSEDDLGDFRHSSSFTDLTSLLSPDEAKHAPAEDTKNEKKRGRANSSVENPKKRAATSKAKKAPAKKEKEIEPVEDDTPNPLDDQKDDDDCQSLKSCSSEADFKSIAKAAVSTLIANASSGKEPKPDEEDEKVDTSTAHIKALTGNNWVAACSGAQSGAQSVASNDSKGNNRARRQNLTPDERARQNRDRNREHARNTRLRKKAYVEELKRTLTEMVAQRDASELEKKQAAQRELEQREVRFRVMEELLKLRGRNEASIARWSAIFEDEFTFILPKTYFRKMVQEDDSSFEQVLAGPKEAMADADCLHEFLLSVGSQVDSNAAALIYECDRKDFFMDGCTATLEWTASAPLAGGTLRLMGSMRSQFSPSSNKLISAKLEFDTGMIQHQLKRLSQGVLEGVEISEEAKAAAKEADAIIDSIQVPGFSSVPSAVNVVPSSGSSSSSADDVSGDKIESSDENSVGDEKGSDSNVGMTTRRVTRRAR